MNVSGKPLDIMACGENLPLVRYDFKERTATGIVLGQGTKTSCYVELTHQFSCQYYVAVDIATDFRISCRYTDDY
ncbi:MAG TPA: hypothetical protein GX524_00855 [Firmicutes bacterium]|jgi:hypothetical protein|nr:hypothetical protein [Bacillota bacterium]